MGAIENSRRKNIPGSRWEGEVEEVLHQSEQSIRLNEKNNLLPRKIENLELVDIIDAQAIQSLMDDLYKLAHIPIGLIDLKGNVLVGVGWQDICTRFHRVNPETCKYCLESDTNLSTGVLPGKFKPYKCKNNMWDIVTPIIVGDQHVGNIFLGQFFFEGEPLDYELFRSQARKYSFNEEEYITALEKVPRLSGQVVNTIMAFFMKLANMLSQLGYSNIKLTQSLAERDALVDALLESEGRFRSVLENSLDSAYRLDFRSNCFDYMSPVIKQITGFSPEEIGALRRNDLLDRIHPDDRQIVVVGIAQSLDKGFGTHEYRFKCKDGKYRWLADHFSIIKDKAGIPRFRAGIVRDITERKKTEEASRLSNLYNRSLIEAGLDPLVTIGHDGKIMDTNGATERVTGYSRNELIGTDFSDYFTEPEKARKGYQQVFINGEVRDYPLEIKHKDGHITPVLYNASVYRDEAGKVIGVFAAARDITDRKKADEAVKRAYENLEKLVKERTVELEEANKSLKESEAGLAEAQKMANIGNWDWNLVTEKVYWSEELYRIFGRNPEEGAPSYNELLSYVHPEDREYVDKSIREGLNDKPKYSIDYRIMLDNGEERKVRAKAEVIFDEQNVPIRVKGINQDITELKKAEQALVEINKIRIKEIHHRIKNNLQVISSLLDLEAERFQNKEVLDAFRESQNRVISMALIHEELYKGGAESLNFSAYLEKLAENLFQTYRLSSKNVSLYMNVERDTFFDIDTAVPLGIIVNELISNSLKHAFTECRIGEIRIQLSKEEKSTGVHESTFNLTISDNGKGMPDDIKLKSTESLGLKLVKILVEQLDGKIELKKTCGTEFRIGFDAMESS
jgi:PAS domain S-box-containing protein